MRNSFAFLFFILLSFSNPALYAVGDPCFSFEVFQHRGVAVPVPVAVVNNALVNYPYINMLANHQALRIAPVPIQVNLGRFIGAPIPWVGVPFAGPPFPLNLANINAVIARRLAHGVQISPQLIAELGVANGLGVITGQLHRSLTAGGYFTEMAEIINMLTLGVFPPGTILGTPIPAFIPDSIIIHIAIPQRVSKNLKELSHSSLATAPGGLTLKDKIDEPYLALGGLPIPDSATIVSSDHLQN
jgi:hypothetical protein